MQVWNKRYKELRAYKASHGDCRVPSTYQENKPLAYWVKTMRSEFKKQQKGESSSLTIEKIEKLNDLGFDWELRAGRKNRKMVPWHVHIKELKEFKKVHGHCRVPMSYQANRPLANWVSNTRYQYGKLQKGENSSLTEERIAELEKLGFEWKGVLGRSDTTRKGGTRNLADGDASDEDSQETESYHEESDTDTDSSSSDVERNTNARQEEDSSIDTDSSMSATESDTGRRKPQSRSEAARSSEETHQEKNDETRKPSLGEQIRAMWEAKLIVISL